MSTNKLIKKKEANVRIIKNRPLYTQNLGSLTTVWKPVLVSGANDQGNGKNPKRETYRR